MTRNVRAHSFAAAVGPAAEVPEFGATGGGMQYLFEKSIGQLLKEGILEEIRKP